MLGAESTASFVRQQGHRPRLSEITPSRQKISSRHKTTILVQTKTVSMWLWPMLQWQVTLCNLFLKFCSQSQANSLVLLRRCWPIRCVRARRHSFGSTRKLCYRKDDRAMRPIGLNGCPENVRELLTIPNIFHGLMFGSTLWMFLQNLKSLALPVDEITGGTQKI